MYNVFLLTIGGDYDLETLTGTNKILAQITVAIYIIVVGVIFINLYVALLSETFMRVYGDARAMSLVKKAEAMLSLEVKYPQLKYRMETHLSRYCSPLVSSLIRISASVNTKERHKYARYFSKIELGAWVSLTNKTWTSLSLAPPFSQYSDNLRVWIMER